nr:hypothetical protein [Tanacetum cinerariifolium]
MSATKSVVERKQGMSDKDVGCHCSDWPVLEHGFPGVMCKGSIYSVKKYVVKPNKEEYRILKNDTYMLEFDGPMTIRKALVKADGFVRCPFQLMDFDGIEPLDNKYLIVVWSSKTLQCLLTSLNPETGPLKPTYVGSQQTRNGWNFPSCGSENYKKSVTRHNSQFFCERITGQYRLELDVSDDTAHVIVVVMFDETATTLVKCYAESLMDVVNECSEDHLSLSPALSNLIGTAHVLEIKTVSSSTLEAVADIQTPKLKRLARHPSIATSSKPIEEIKKGKGFFWGRGTVKLGGNGLYV